MRMPRPTTPAPARWRSGLTRWRIRPGLWPERPSGPGRSCATTARATPWSATPTRLRAPTSPTPTSRSRWRSTTPRPAELSLWRSPRTSARSSSRRAAMTMLLAWVVFPLVLLALCVGMGLLVDAISGRRLPGALVPLVGLAATVVAVSFTTMSGVTAEFSLPLVALGAAAGAWLSRPWRFGRPDGWAAGVAVAVFCVFGAPVIASGDPTFAGYIKLDDTATWIAITDRVMEEGRGVEGLEPSTYRRTLEVYPGDGYPIGANLPWGTARELVRVDNAWVFQPYLSFLAALIGLALFALARPLVASRRLRALVAFVAAQAALLYGFALWGGMKEVLAAALVAAAALALPQAVTRLRGQPAEAVVPLALIAAALAASLSFAGLVWLVPLLLGAAYWAWRELGPSQALARAAWFIVAGAVFTIPVIATGRI